MGRTPKLLTLLVSDELADTATIQELAEQGHKVWSYERFEVATTRNEEGIPYFGEFDLILGPNCQLMTLAHLKYLPEAIKRVRKVKYG